MAERPCVPRVAWVDVTKGLAMLFVMSNHCGFPYGPLCYFVVPAFFILAGVMLKPVEDFSRFALLKVRRLMVPYVVWNLLFMVIVLPGYFFSDGLLLSLRRIAVGLAESVNYPLWFLKALLWAFLIVGLLVSRRAFSGTMRGSLVLSGMVGAGLFTGSIWWERWISATDLPQGVIAASLLAAGYMFREPLMRFMSRLGFRKSLAYTGIALAVFVLGVRGDNHFHTGYMMHPRAFYPSVAVSFAAGALLSKTLSFWKFFNPLEYIGRNSMNYFCIHAIVVCLAGYKGWTTLVVTIIVTTTVNVALQKFKGFFWVKR